MSVDPRTGTNLRPFEQAIANVQDELDATNNMDLGYIPPVSKRVAEVMDSIVKVGNKQYTIGQVAENYGKRKLGELPGVQNIQTNVEGYEKYMAGLFPNLDTADKAVQEFKDTDWKSMLTNDIANRLGLPDDIKQDILAGRKVGDATKNYLTSKLNSSSIPLNIERQRGDTYKVSKDFSLGDNATIGVSEYLNSNRDAQASFNYRSGNLSARADKTDGRPTQARVSYNWDNPDKNTTFGISAGTDPRSNHRDGEIEFKFEKKLLGSKR